MKKQIDTEVIEFVPEQEAGFSPTAVEPVRATTLAPSTTLEEMTPIFRELALPRLPELRRADRARLQMQTPTRLFFYWSVGSNPFQKLNKALGMETTSYTLVLKLVDLKRESETFYPAEVEGSSWFDVDTDGEYRADVGFYAPNRPFVRVLFSNTVTTPRNSPSPRVASDADWAIPAERFARVLEVAGFTEDAFDVAIAGDDHASADTATRAALGELLGGIDTELDSFDAEEIRHAMFLIASGLTLEGLRWKIGARLFALMQRHAASLNAAKATAILKERFAIEAEEITEEEIGSAVFGASAINFPRRLTTRRRLPKLSPVRSPARSPLGQR